VRRRIAGAIDVQEVNRTAGLNRKRMVSSAGLFHAHAGPWAWRPGPIRNLNINQSPNGALHTPSIAIDGRSR
jgi:hypothetical protein